MSIWPNNNGNMIACTVLVDCSGSMDFDVKPGYKRIDALEDGLEVLSREMKMDATVRNCVEICLIDFGGEQKPHGASIIQDWVYARDFVAPKLEPIGSTPLGEAVLLALEKVKQKKEDYRRDKRLYCRPWIIIISDGAKTDSDSVWAQAVLAAQKVSAAKGALILSVGVDEECSLDELSQLSSLPARPLASHRFSEFFKWLSASMSSTSRSDTSKEQFASTNGFTR